MVGRPVLRCQGRSPGAAALGLSMWGQGSYYLFQEREEEIWRTKEAAQVSFMGGVKQEERGKKR